MRGHSVRWTVMADALGSWRMWLVVAAVLTLTPLFGLIPPTVGWGRIITSAMVAAAAMLAVAWCGWLVVLRHLAGLPRVVAAIPVVLLAAVTRGVVLQALLEAGAAARYWIVSSCLSVSIAVVVGTLVKVGIDGQRYRLEYLAAEQRRLSAVLTQAEQELRGRQSGAVAGVSAAVAQELAELPDATALLAVDSLQHLASDVVRPLSHDLAATVPVWQPPEPPDAGQRLDWSRVWGSVADPGQLDPWGPAAVTLVAAPPSMIVMGFWSGLLLHLVLAAAVALGLTVVRRTTGGRFQQLPTPLRLAVVYGLAVIGCIPAGAIVVWTPGPSSSMAEAAWIMLVLPLVALLLSVIRAARTQQRELDAEAAAVVAQTRWWISRTRLVSWWQRSVMARALHGPVQSAIHAAVQRLRFAEESGTATPKVVEDTLAEVRAALSDAVLPERPGLDVTAKLAATTATWRPVAEIVIECADSTARQLQLDQVCAEMTVDVVVEAVSNAVRHGGARQLKVTVHAPQGGVVSAEVVDDGQGRDEIAEPGLGTAMLDACALAWGFRQQMGWHVVWFELAWLDPTATQASLPTEHHAVVPRS